MPRRAHAASGRALPWILVGLLVLVASGAGAWALLRDGAPEDEEDLPVPDLVWTIGRVRSTSVDADASQGDLEEARDAIADLLDDLYTTAFVDPAKWEGGAFPELGSYFAGSAAARAERDRDGLTLGEDAARIERVEPTRATLRLTFLVDPQAAPYAAVATAGFRADGRTTDGGAVAIVHQGRYMVRRIEGEWRIIGYDVEGSLESVADPGPGTPGATP
ncbi:MAG TPA: hypothetical protein VF058_01300 [Actinomycetota bacterium]